MEDSQWWNDSDTLTTIALVVLMILSLFNTISIIMVSNQLDEILVKYGQ